MQLEAQLRLCQSCLRCYRGGLRLLSQTSIHRTAVSYYDLLGVKADAPLDQIKNAFFDKSKKLHPDRDPSNPALHGQFVELSEAYRVLSREATRREYDLRLRQPFPGAQPFRPTSTHNPRAAAQESMRYWEQFRHAQPQPQETSSEERERSRKRKFRIVSYCLVTIVLGIGSHLFIFRKLEQFHNSFMDEKDRVITEIYNTSKERARVNGFKKQTAILRQKHAEFLEKYKINGGQDKSNTSKEDGDELAKGN